MGESDQHMLTGYDSLGVDAWKVGAPWTSAWREGRVFSLLAQGPSVKYLLSLLFQAKVDTAVTKTDRNPCSHANGREQTQEAKRVAC